jgi:hypothetical protein
MKALPAPQVFITLTFLLLSAYFYLSFSKSLALSECTGHKENNFHVHSRIEIVQNNTQIKIPRNTGINGNCIHPIHTHDETGLVHIDYPRDLNFTLGDFFDVMGIIFQDNQVGNLKKYDGYKIEVKVDNKIIKSNFRKIVLEDQKKIKIEITN